jgi:hypothetical protein
MSTTKITKIILERDGEEKEAVLVSDAELQSFAEEFKAKGIDIFSCNCGDEICWYGRVWRCAYGSDGRCQWFRSDWQCQ